MSSLVDRRWLSVLLVLGLWNALAPPVRADRIAYTVTGASALGENGNATYGFQFSTNAPILVTQFGFFDEFGDGLGDGAFVGLWDLSGTLLVSAVVPGGVAAPLVDQFRYTDVSPTLLEAGQTYRIGATSSDRMIQIADGFVADPSITFEGNRVGLGPFTFPVFSFPVNPGVFGPNFQFTPVPEPSSVVLLGLAGLGAAGGWWRRKRREA